MSEFSPKPPVFKKNKRSQRYTGEELGLALEAFEPSVASSLRELYPRNLELLECARSTLEQKSAKPLLEYLQRTQWSPFLDKIKRNLVTQQNDPQKRKILHDIRGGAFCNLCLMLDLVQMLGEGASLLHLERIFLLTRDHLKIMRNCFVDLDPEGRAADLSHNLHSTALLREKWDGFEIEGKRVLYTSEEDVDVACCCMEFSTLDRVVYNLLNNALRHTSDDSVRLSLDVLHPESGDGQLRILVQNQISQEDRSVLTSTFGEDLSKLFSSGFSSTGSGLGLSICGECVSNAYGLDSASYAQKEDFVGAKLTESTFYAWAHWPLIAD